MVKRMRKHPKTSRKYPFSLLIALKPMVTITGDKKRSGKAIARYFKPFLNVFLAGAFSKTYCFSVEFF
jgi:hypothetical protein